MVEFDRVLINKNRGWRGLAEIIVLDEIDDETNKMIFSFSQAVWDDLMDGYIVVQKDEFYYILEIDNLKELPIGHQRSVLIKDFKANIRNVTKVDKHNWHDAEYSHTSKILHFLDNRNNHTTSDWNCIGVRVIPNI